MINKETFKKVLESGVDLTQFLILHYLNANIDIEDISNNIRVSTAIITLIRKDFVNEAYKLTTKGSNFINNLIPKMQENVSLKRLYEEIEEVIISYTGNKQITNPSGKNLKPSYVIFENRINEFIKKFKIENEDLPKIRKALLQYVKAVCNKEIPYPLALIYFIYTVKNGGLNSELLEWFDKEESTNFDGINL